MRVSIETAIQLLLQEEVVAIPTETVYGLAAMLSSSAAIAKVFTLKNRPIYNPLIIHVANKEQCEKYVDLMPPGAHHLIETFWPGPLTLLLPIHQSLIPTVARAGLPTAAFRLPDHPIARAIIEKSGPLVAPSANLSGKPSSTNPTHVEKDFGAHFPVVDAGSTTCGIESTILAFDKKTMTWKLARQGSLTVEQIESVLGYHVDNTTLSPHPICPGQLLRHYAPKATLILTEKPEGPYVVGFSDRTYALSKKIFVLGASTNPNEVAHNLYKILRQLDEENIPLADVDIHFPKNEGLWATVLERLSKAAQ